MRASIPVTSAAINPVPGLPWTRTIQIPAATPITAMISHPSPLQRTTSSPRGSA
jgi:hypothetical protein